MRSMAGQGGRPWPGGDSSRFWEAGIRHNKSSCAQEQGCQCRCGHSSSACPVGIRQQWQLRTGPGLSVPMWPQQQSACPVGLVTGSAQVSMHPTSPPPLAMQLGSGRAWSCPSPFSRRDLQLASVRPK